jgi:hypothetical protein
LRTEEQISAPRALPSEAVSADIWQARDQGFIIHGGFGAPMAIPTEAGPRHPEYCGF